MYLGSYIFLQGFFCSTIERTFQLRIITWFADYIGSQVPIYAGEFTITHMSKTCFPAEVLWLLKGGACFVTYQISIEASRPINFAIYAVKIDELN